MNLTESHKSADKKKRIPHVGPVIVPCLLCETHSDGSFFPLSNRHYASIYIKLYQVISPLPFLHKKAEALSLYKATNTIIL